MTLQNVVQLGQREPRHLYAIQKIRFVHRQFCLSIADEVELHLLYIAIDRQVIVGIKG